MEISTRTNENTIGRCYDLDKDGHVSGCKDVALSHGKFEFCNQIIAYNSARINTA